MGPSHEDEPLELPEGWFYEHVGTVLVRTKAPEHLSFDQLVRREVESSLALGDERSPHELESDIRAELESRIGDYGSSSDVTRQ